VTELLQIDAFTDRPFAGNPAAVALLAAAADPSWMQSVAAEMNLAETAFVTPAVDGVHGLRWFTPAVEVDLCGHATLASAHALWSTGRVAAGEVIRFATRSGELRATADGRLIALDLPANRAVDGEAPAGFLEALGVAKPVRVGVAAGDWVLVEVATEAEVRALAGVGEGRRPARAVGGRPGRGRRSGRDRARRRARRLTRPCPGSPGHGLSRRRWVTPDQGGDFPTFHPPDPGRRTGRAVRLTPLFTSCPGRLPPAGRH
jgi:hypothetical protein